MIKHVTDFDGRDANGNTTVRKRSHAMANNVLVVTKLNKAALGSRSLHMVSPMGQIPMNCSGNKNGRHITDPLAETTRFITK